MCNEVSFYTVSQLVDKFSWHCRAFSDFLWLKGEVVNLSFSQMGHVFFSLRDEKSLLDCVVFDNSSSYTTHDIVTGEVFDEESSTLSAHSLKTGDFIYCAGRILPYKARSKYQFVVELIQAVDIGNRHLLYIEQEQKYLQAGYFDEKRKKKLPKNPQRILLITSLYGAVIQDFLHVAHQFAVDTQIVLYPVAIQGRTTLTSILHIFKLLKASYRSPLEKSSLSINTPQTHCVQSLEMYAQSHASQYLQRYPLLSKAYICSEENILSQRFDLVLVLRGGGAETDFDIFNDPTLLEETLSLPLPCAVALGHAPNTTFFDKIVDASFITPTASAYALWDSYKYSYEYIQVLYKKFCKTFFSAPPIQRYLETIKDFSHAFLLLLQKYTTLMYRLYVAVQALEKALKHLLKKYTATLLELFQKSRNLVVSRYEKSLQSLEQQLFSFGFLEKLLQEKIQIHNNHVYYTQVYLSKNIHNFFEKSLQKYNIVLSLLKHNDPSSFLEKGYCKLELIRKEQRMLQEYTVYRVYSKEGTFIVYRPITQEEVL